LLSVGRRADHLYRVAKRIVKPDGTERITFDAKPELKQFQGQILKRLLRNIEYPDYLHGSLSGRDYRSNARVHSGSRLLISEDVSNFFPSVSSDVVFDVWRRLFRFADPVARLLTTLTTLNGSLPQGAKTSSHLANLALWKTEPRLVHRLNRLGFRYTRYVDDISASTVTRSSSQDQAKAIAAIYSTLARSGLQAKREKHNIQSSRGRMTVTKLTVNEKPAISKKERARIRAAVQQCEIFGNVDSNAHEYRKLLASTIGRVQTLRRFHQKRGEQLLGRLKAIGSRTGPIEGQK
jgi:hypothetical protein